MLPMKVKTTHTRLRFFRPIRVGLYDFRFLKIKIDGQLQGGFNLHFIELLPVEKMPNPNDFIIENENKPRLTIEMWHGDGLEGPTESVAPREIAAFVVSLSGSIGATLSFSDTHAHLYLWELTPPKASPSGAPPSILKTPYAGTTIPFASLGLDSKPNLSPLSSQGDLSLSRDGQYISLITPESYEDDPTSKRILLVFMEPTFTTPADEKTSLKPKRLSEVLIRDFPGLQEQECNVAFQLVPSKNDGRPQEVFIIRDGSIVYVYKTGDSFDLHRRLIMNNSARLVAQERYIAWRETAGLFSIWNYLTGLFVSRISILLPRVSIVEKQSLMNNGRWLLSEDNTRTTKTARFYCTATGTEIARFDYGDTPIFRYINLLDNDLLICRLYCYLDDIWFFGHASNLDLYRHEGFAQAPRLLEDREGRSIRYNYLDIFGCSPQEIVRFYRERSKHCHECTDSDEGDGMTRIDFDKASLLVTYSDKGREFILDGTTSREWTNASGKTKDVLLVVVTMECEDGHSKQVLSVPSIPFDVLHTDEHDYYHTSFFIEKEAQVVIVSWSHIQIWDLPLEPDESACRLRLIWRIQDDGVSSSIDLGSYHTKEVFVCTNGRHLIVKQEEEYDDETPREIAVSVDDCFSKDNAHRFLPAASLVLPQIYHMGDDSMKETILRYLWNYINNYQNPADSSVSLMNALIDGWTLESQTVWEELFKDLLNPGERSGWKPSDAYSKESNPFCHVLELSKTKPRILGLAQIMIDYCVAKANLESNLGYMYAAMGSLSMFSKGSEHKPRHQEMTLGLLRSLAYIPVKDDVRTFIIKSHVIAHPPEIRKFWTPNTRPLYECTNPILQIVAAEKNLDPGNDNFTHDLFVAAFDMLWDRYRLVPEDDSGEVSGLTWVRASMYGLWQTFTAAGEEYVVCHEFHLLAFDNPAIAALIEYKW
ncbi:hypothetical protein BGX20_011584 [Mortierella sp. AD010]|nr:hypothetical protein BGX20_011584 [Mortierella sp. AD010]